MTESAIQASCMRRSIRMSTLARPAGSRLTVVIHVTVITRWITQENFDLTVRNVSAQSSSRQVLVIPTDRTESFRYFCEPFDRGVINLAKPPTHWLKLGGLPD